MSPPGDIPDNQAFVAYSPPGAGYSVKVPEGWARTSSGGAVTFTDKLNSIRLESSAAGALTPCGTVSALLWAGGAGLAGLAVAAGAIVLPGWREARSMTVAGQRRQVGRLARAPWWSRYGVDFLALAGAVLVYWQASRNGYKLVLAPEGVPQVSVNSYALLAPMSSRSSTASPTWAPTSRTSTGCVPPPSAPPGSCRTAGSRAAAPLG